MQTILKDVYTAIKAPTSLKNPLLIATFIKNLGSWDSTLGILKNLGAIWTSGGALGDLGGTLYPARLAELGKVIPFIEDGGTLARGLGSARLGGHVPRTGRCGLRGGLHGPAPPQPQLRPGPPTTG